jgi:hypothetical protein
MTTDEKNKETSRKEVEGWKANPPDKYFLYIQDTGGKGPWHLEGQATTWTGDILGTVRFGREYRSNFGDKRVPVVVFGNNGVKYHGTYYKSAGDYARIRRHK